MQSFVSLHIFLVPIAVGLLAELTKILLEGLEQGTWRGGILRSGGMPSSHSALTASLLIVVGTLSGLSSTTFAIAACVACITWYDAAISRKAIGDQAKILNRLQKRERLTERLGHSLAEVIGGIAFGVATTIPALSLTL